MIRPIIVRTVLCCCAVLLLVTACGGSPEERVARLRGMYTARLPESEFGNFIVRPRAPEPEMLTADEELVAEEEGAEPAEPAEPAAEEEMAPAEPAEPATVDISFDILIQHDSPELLPGITVDISMADAAGNEKGAWKVWFDTADLPKANIRSYPHVLEDVAYEEGDGFSVEIRHPVPVEERGEYREFSAAG